MIDVKQKMTISSVYLSGGAVVVPALAIIMQFDHKTALGTSMAGQQYFFCQFYVMFYYIDDIYNFCIYLLHCLYK